MAPGRAQRCARPGIDVTNGRSHRFDRGRRVAIIAGRRILKPSLRARSRGQSVTDKRYAVVVGEDDSAIGAALPPLRYAARDAESFRDLLCDPAIGTYDPADVELFAGPYTSAAAIKTALRRFALYSDPSDTLLVYFAGHTLTPAWSLGNDVYLVTPDLDEAALGEDPDAGLRLSYLKQDVLELFAGSATLILDCCRSGSLRAAPGR